MEVLDDLIVRRFPMPLPATKWSSLHRSATIGPRTLFSMRNAADAFRPDLLHVVCFGPNGAYATALARLTGLPLMVTLQGETVMDDSDIFDTSRVLRSALRRGLRTASAVTGCSAFTLDDAERRFGLEPGRGLVIANGVDLERCPLRDRVLPVIAPITPTRRSAGTPGSSLCPGAGPGRREEGIRPVAVRLRRHRRARRTVDLVIGGTGPALDGLRTWPSNSA